MFANLQSTRVIGYGNFETTEGPHADPPVGNVDSHNIFCSWFAQAHAPFTHAISRTDIPKDKKSTESCSIVVRKELQVEQFWFHVYPSTVQWVQGLKSNSLVCKEEHKSKG